MSAGVAENKDNNVVMILQENELTEMISVNIICRLCANQSDKLIGIYSEDGISNDLANKMNLYLPVKVTETDDLPLQCCWQCASTVLAWHDLVVTSVEADRRLRSYQFFNGKQLQQIDYDGTNDITSSEQVNGINTDTVYSSLNVFCQTDTSSDNNLTSEKIHAKLLLDKNKSQSPYITPDTIVYHVNLQQFIPLRKDEETLDGFKPDLPMTVNKNIELPRINVEEKDENFSNDSEVVAEEIQTVYNFACQYCAMVFSTEDDVICHIKNLHAHLLDSLKCTSDETTSKETARKEKTSNHNDVLQGITTQKDQSILSGLKEEQLLPNVAEELEEKEESYSDESQAGVEESDASYSFACHYCPTIFLTEDDVMSHIKDSHPDAEEIPLSQASKQNLKKEKRKNNKIDQDLVNAAKVVVDGRIYYNCKECGKSLHSPYTYVWHMRIHTGERPYVCDLCGKQFRVSQGLVRHLKETHERIKKFSCDICGRMFATRRNVEEHRRIHTNERPYICDLCGKSFKQKASLFVHNRSHSNLFPFKCTYCSQAFRTKPPLLIHITRHTGEKPFACDVCGRCFRIKYELKRHRLIHSDEKPFACATCGQCFRQKRYLRNHNKLNHQVGGEPVE